MNFAALCFVMLILMIDHNTVNERILKSSGSNQLSYFPLRLASLTNTGNYMSVETTRVSVHELIGLISATNKARYLLING